MGWPCPVRSSLIRTEGRTCRITVLFSYCFTTFLAPHIKKLETYFCPVIFLDFRTVCRMFQRCIVSKFGNFDTISSSFVVFLIVGFFFTFCSSVSVSSNSSEELRQQIRRHKATRPPIEEEEPEKTNQDSQDSVHSMYSFSNRILLCTCLENLRCTIN